MSATRTKKPGICMQGFYTPRIESMIDENAIQKFGDICMYF